MTMILAIRDQEQLLQRRLVEFPIHQNEADHSTIDKLHHISIYQQQIFRFFPLPNPCRYSGDQREQREFDIHLKWFLCFMFAIKKTKCVQDNGSASSDIVLLLIILHPFGSQLRVYGPINIIKTIASNVFR